MSKHRRLFRNGAEQLMLQAATDYCVEDRVLAVRHRVDFHHVTLGTLAVILRKLAERAFRLAHARQEAAFDHDLGLGRHANVAREALHHRQRPPLQRARDLQLIAIDRGDGLRGEQGQRIDADDHGGFERLAALFRHLEEHVGMAWQQQHAEPVWPAQLAAVDGDVLLSRMRVAGDHQAGRDVRPAVMLVVGGERKQPREIDLTMDHRLCRRRRNFLPRQRIERRVLIAGKDFTRLHAHRFGHPAAIGDEPGNNRDRVPARAREQGGAQPIEALGERGELEAQIDIGLDDRQPVARRQMIEPLA